MMPCLLFVSTLAGCFAPSTGTDEGGPGAQPPGGLFGADGGVNVGCMNPDSSPLSSLSIRVRTTAFGGRYAPRNIGAIWIETAAGQFVKTIERWGKTRARYLTRFNTSSGGNIVDAITSATLSNHTTHERMWNLSDKTECEVPAGSYKVVIEMTDRDGPGTSLEIPWTKGTAPQTFPATDNTYFHDLLLDVK